MLLVNLALMHSRGMARMRMAICWPMAFISIKYPQNLFWTLSRKWWKKLANSPFIAKGAARPEGAFPEEHAQNTPYFSRCF